MEKRELIVAVLLLTTLLSVGFVSAEISIQEPEAVYSLGDRLYVTVNGIVGADSGNFNIDLQCGSVEINLVKVSARSFSNAGESAFSEYKILNKEDLEIDDLEEILGECKLTATLGSDQDSTNNFEISKDITLEASTDKTSYDPAETIILTVTATKANGQPLEGFIQGINAVDFVKPVVGGSLTHTFSLPADSESGKYEVSLIAYDLQGEGNLNQGEDTFTFLINQIPTTLTPSISEQDVTPGTTLKVGAQAYDQSGKEIAQGTVSFKTISPSGEEEQQILSLGSFAEFDFASNAPAGIWKIEVFHEELVEQREFNVVEHQEVNYDIEDAVLTVTNVGNTLYDQQLSVKIGEETRTLDLFIDVGGQQRFNLKAPQGTYDVTVGDGEEALSRQVLLTGNAISIKSIREGGLFKNYTLVWVFILLIIAGTAIFFLLKYRKTKTLKVKPEKPVIVTNEKKTNPVVNKIKAVSGVFKKKVDDAVPKTVKKNLSESMHFTNKSPAAHSLDPKHHVAEDKTLKDYTKKKGNHAESTLVLKGEKHPSAVLCLSIKNYSKLNENSLNELKNIVDISKKNKGVIDWRGEYIFIIYAPLITKTYHNENLAVKAASEILESLKVHNKKFNNKIEYNIGIHSGELLTSKQGKKLKYTSIGNTVALAKRMGDNGNKKLLVSEAIRKKMLRDMKVEQHKQIGEHNIYSVTELKNNEANKAKLKELLKRIDK